LQAISSAAESFSNVPLYIDETASLSIMQLRGKCRNLKKEHGIRLVIVDYLGLMEGDGDNREQVVSKISRHLKGIAKELNVPVIALSQLSRAVESRGGSKRPGLSDLRDSGGIEEAADMVCFIYRPEYYHIAEDESGNSTQDMAEIIIAKHRNGACENGGVGAIRGAFFSFGSECELSLSEGPAERGSAVSRSLSLSYLSSFTLTIPLYCGVTLFTVGCKLCLQSL